MANSLLLNTILTFLFLHWSHVNSKPSNPANDFISGNFSRAAISSNAAPCAEIAKSILLKGGKAVDAAIALLICEGVVNPQGSGLGGGFTMTIYDKSSGKAHTINAREYAPAATIQHTYNTKPELAETGALAIAVPGEVRGYLTAYKKFGGGVTWKQLFEPTIELCENGIPVSTSLTASIYFNLDLFAKNKDFGTTFTSEKTGRLLTKTEKYKNLKMAKTLKTIADEGGNTFYEGTLAKTIVQEIRAKGGIITEEDLKNYQPRLEDPIQATIFENFTIHTLNPPSSGAILIYILKLMQGLVPTGSELLDTHRITEAFKFAYGARSKLGDPRFVNITESLKQITSEDSIKQVRNTIDDTRTWTDPDHYGGDYTAPHDRGTANIAVISENGDAVVATTTINDFFGSRVMSSSTGIIFNNQMSDFCFPNTTNIYFVEPSKANYIAAGKIPMTSTTPTIVTDKNGDVRLAIGGAGGPKITSAVAIAIMRSLVLDEDIKKAVGSVFFHHQLLPMVWNHYHGISRDVISGMRDKGHLTFELDRTFFFPAITAIERKNGQLLSCSDFRSGQVAGY